MSKLRIQLIVSLVLITTMLSMTVRNEETLKIEVKNIDDDKQLILTPEESSPISKNNEIMHLENPKVDLSVSRIDQESLSDESKTLIKRSSTEQIYNQTDSPFTLDPSSRSIKRLIYCDKWNLVFADVGYAVYVYNRTDNSYRSIIGLEGTRGSCTIELDCDNFTDKLIVVTHTKDNSWLSVFDLPSLSLNYSLTISPLRNIDNTVPRQLVSHDQYGNIFLANKENNAIDIFNVISGNHTSSLIVPFTNIVGITYDLSGELLFAISYSGDYGYYDFALESWYNTSLSGVIKALTYLPTAGQLVMSVANGSGNYFAFYDPRTNHISFENTTTFTCQIAFDSVLNVLYYGQYLPMESEYYSFDLTTNLSTQIPTSFRSAVYQSVAFDVDGRILYMSSMRGLYAYNVSNGQLYHVPFGLNSITSFEIDSDEGVLYPIWSNYTDGLRRAIIERINSTTMEIVESGYSHEICSIRLCAFDSIFFFSDRAFQRYNKTSLVAISSNYGYNLYQVAKDEINKRLFMVGKNYSGDCFLWTYDFLSDSITNVTFDSHVASSRSASLSTYIEEKDVYIFVGYEESYSHESIYSFDPTSQVISAEYNSSYDIKTIFYDNKTDNFILGTNKGIVVLNGSFYETDIITTASSLTGFVKGNEEDLLYAVSMGSFGIYNVTSKIFVALTSKDGLPVNRYVTIKYDFINDRVLIGSYLGLISYYPSLGNVEKYFKSAEVFLNSPANGTVVTSDCSINMTVTSDNSYQVLYNWDSTEDVILVEPWNISVPLLEGWHNLTVKAITDYGVVTERIYFFLVNTPPMIEEFHRSEQGSLVTSEATYTYYFADDIGVLDRIWANWNGETNESVPIENTQGKNYFYRSWTVPAIDGEYVLSLYANDSYGLVANYTLKIEVDANAPTVEGPDDLNYDYGTTGHSLTWYLDDSNPAIYRIFRNDSDIAYEYYNSPETVTINIDGLTAGVHNYTIYAWDYLYRISADSVIVIVNDIVSPTVNDPPDVTCQYGSVNNTISWIAKDLHPTNFFVYRDEKMVINGSWTCGVAVVINVDGLAVGTYNYSIIFFDVSGNKVNDEVIVLVVGSKDSSTITTTESNSPKFSESTTPFTIWPISFLSLITIGVIFHIRRCIRRKKLTLTKNEL